ncbi:MAG TPA: hypothetical protein VFZ32_11370 [Micromonosporaceae bacterium]
MDDQRDILDYGSALVAQAVVSSINLTLAAWQFGRDVRALVSALVRVTEPGGPLDRLADLADEIRPLLRDVAALRDSPALTQLGEALERLPELNESVARLADSFETLGQVGEALPRVADRLAMLPELVALTRDVERRVGQVGSRLESLGGLAGTIVELQRSVRTLGGTLEPLQGTAERVGRLIERFPSSRRRPGESADGPATEPGGAATSASER